MGCAPTLDAQKSLFQSIDISHTVRRIEARYSGSGRGRRRYPVRAMLLSLMLMHLLRMPTVAMLATQLSRHKEYGELCGFNGATPERSIFSKFITRAEPRTVEGVFVELRRQALKMSLYGRRTSVVGAVDSTFIHAYSRRKRKAGVSGRGARVGKVEQTTYALGWRAHNVATEERLPLCYTVRSANVNDKVPAPKLVRQAVTLLEKAGSPIRALLADPQYYGADFFSLIWGLGAKAVIPAPCTVKEPLIHLRVKRGFILEGEPKLLKLYHRRMMVEHVFKSGKM